ncbi:hypothetical protein [Actinoplanes philippinensis]|uniref:hypothetical protein n=1 Tax=Actinoplanes philippinensis TaxID=35752 RepID=UPI0033C6C440
MSLRHYLSSFRAPVDDSVLLEVAPQPEDRLFWPAFLLTVGGSLAAATSFDVDPADVEEYADNLHQPASWPFVTVPLARGHRLHVLFRNFEGDAGWDYLLHPAGSDSVITLAALEGGFHGPGLNWPELLAVADQADPAWTREERLLLLLPAVGDADLAHDAEELIATAFTTVGGRPDHRHEVAGELLTASRRFWGSPTWVEYQNHRICSNEHSPRNLAAPPSRHALMAEAFGYDG